MGLTDVGRKREANEDSFIIEEGVGLYMVADGMGGHQGGGTASKMAVETVAEMLQNAKQLTPDPFTDGSDLEKAALPDHFRQAVEAACYRIFHRAREEPTLAGMGTTACALVIRESQREGHVDAFVAHVGDSRLYIFRGDTVQQVSEDHSLVEEQVRAGVLTREEAEHSRFKNIITRSVGFEEDVLVDVMGLWALPGDVFLICSDGLSNYFSPEEFHRFVLDHPGDQLQQLPKTLIDAANARGGEDNITAVVVRVEEA